MKDQIPSNIEGLRITSGPMASDSAIGRNGLFEIPYARTRLKVMVSDQLGWDHISVSTSFRTPSWEEMCFIKNLFFKKEEAVIQFHPPESVYVNACSNCLHLWRNQRVDVELPPLSMV